MSSSAATLCGSASVRAELYAEECRNSRRVVCRSPPGAGGALDGPDVKLDLITSYIRMKLGARSYNKTTYACPKARANCFARVLKHIRLLGGYDAVDPDVSFD